MHSLVYFWDVVPDAVAKARSAGCRVLYHVGLEEQALAAEAAGADAVIAQGVEAGGHVHCLPSSCCFPKSQGHFACRSSGRAASLRVRASSPLWHSAPKASTAEPPSLPLTSPSPHDILKYKVIAATSRDTVYTDAYAINWPPDSPVRVIASPETDHLGRNLWGHAGEDIPKEVIAEEEGPQSISIRRIRLSDR